MSKLNQEELLSILETAFSHLLKDINYKETKAKYEQAHLQIKEMIQETKKARLIWDATCPGIDAGWLPTAENINALPEPIRNYIAGLETNADPPSMVADNIIMKDTIKTLEKMLEEVPEITDEWTAMQSKKICELIKDAQEEDLSDPVTGLHYLGLSLDIVTSIIDDLRPKNKQVEIK